MIAERAVNFSSDAKKAAFITWYRSYLCMFAYLMLIILAILGIVSAIDVITTIAGTGSSSFSGDGGAATSAEFKLPKGVQLDTAGNILLHIR